MRLLPHLLAVALAGALLAGCPGPPPWQGIKPEEYARLNAHRLIGIAQMENDQEHLALPEFEAIRKAQPGLAFGHVNAAVALLGLKDRLKDAQAAADAGVERQPDLAWARLVQARVQTAAAQPDKATAALEKAVALDGANPRILGALVEHLRGLPGDHAARLHELSGKLAEVAPENLAVQSNWLLGQAQRGEPAGALATLEKVVALLPRTPANLGDLLKTAREALSTGSADADRPVRGFVNTLKADPLYADSFNSVYGNNQDPADLSLRAWDAPPPALPEPALKDVSITWKDVTRDAGLATLTVAGIAPVAVGDVDLGPAAGGQRPDATLNPLQVRPDLVAGPGAGRLWIKGDAAFAPGASTPFAGAAAAGSPISPLLLDLNNDFTLDLYLADPAGDRVWKQTRSGTETEKGITFQMKGLAGAVAVPGAKSPGTATAVDLDVDGDLDVIRTSSAPGTPAVRYLRNNGAGALTDVPAPALLSLPARGARQTVFGDFDDDGDPDLFVACAGGPSQLILNRRQDVFRSGTAEWGLKPEPGAMAGAVADFDRDGDWDLAVAGRAPHGSLLYRNEGKRFAADSQALASLGGGDWDWVQVLDYDNDTWLDIVFAGKAGVRLLRNEAGKFTDGGSPLAEAATWVKPLDYDQDGDLDLLAAVAGGKLRLLSNEGGNGRPWLKAELQGVLRKALGTDDKQFNNSYAIGAVLEPRTTWETQRILVTDPQTHVGLGRAERALTLRVTWTHGVPQNRIAPQTGSVIHHLQKPSGSCPFLYTWDGEKWVFACDFNWRSPLGMLFARGASVPHDQTLDWVKISGDRTKPVGDYYPLIATEELREISYFDQLRFLAVDHPAATEIYVDERFKMGPPDPFRIYTATDRRPPVSARNDAGEDLLPALQSVDRVYTPVPPGPYRGVRAPHDLILDLGPVPDPANVKLFLHGWIYPAGTSTNVAAGQDPSVRVIPPTLYVGDGQGGWSEADRNVGLPCGKRKTIVLDLSSRFKGDDFRVKLSTTMEIRWDQVFFTSGETPGRLRQSELPLAEADLRERGYGTRYREVEEGPDLFDYNRPLPPDEPGWPGIAGAYTRLGDCAELLRTIDDRCAIVAPGDEVRLLFDARKLPPLPVGWKRDFILISDGWTKDTDPNTLAGETVGPLPFHGMKRYPYGPEERFPDTPAHRAWQREWNTRVKRRVPQAPFAGATRVVP